MYRDKHVRINQFNSHRSPLWAHGEMAADTCQHHIYFVKLLDQRHIGEDIDVTDMITMAVTNQYQVNPCQ